MAQTDDSCFSSSSSDFSSSGAPEAGAAEARGPESWRAPRSLGLALFGTGADVGLLLIE